MKDFRILNDEPLIRDASVDPHALMIDNGDEPVRALDGKDVLPVEYGGGALQQVGTLNRSLSTHQGKREHNSHKSDSI